MLRDFLCCDPPCPIAISARDATDALGFQITHGTASPATSTLNSISITSFARYMVLLMCGLWFIAGFRCRAYGLEPIANTYLFKSWHVQSVLQLCYTRSITVAIPMPPP